ncbi:A24 family peptidase [Leclercia sp.]|uniref:prepilin peptidase n=1 Tax=Leclercia sp. TaxID=1898428 RepID=UPI0028A07FD1|nr:A24 family peptidase [Leclercia sp.]
MTAFALFRESSPALFSLMSAIFGAIIGSFLGVVAERIPPMLLEDEARINLLFPASHCPACQHDLAWWENIPLVSWLALRGRCHHCGSAIPLRLWLLEAFTFLFFGATAWCMPDIPALFSLWLLSAFLLPLAIIDGRHLLLPDCLTQPLLWAGLLVHLISPTLPLRDAIIGAVAGYLSLWLIYWAFRLMTGREGLGYGDFKLLAALGAWCGWQALPDVLLLASLTGIAGHLLFIKSDKKAAYIPFGPALAVGGVIAFILQNYSLIP